MDSGRLALLLGIVLISAYTLAPFEFLFYPRDFNTRIAQAFTINTVDSELKSLAHFVAFLALGALVSTVYAPLFVREGFGRFFFIAILGCVGLELGQFLQESRHARVTDLLSNITALLIGTMAPIQQRSLSVVRVKLEHMYRRYSIPIQLTLVFAAMATWFSAGFYPVSALGGLEWSTDFHLIVGDEVDRSEPWLGELRFLGVYEGALSREQVQDSYRRLVGEVTRRSTYDGMLAGYDFSNDRDGCLSPIGSLESENLSMQIPRATEKTAEGGLLLTKPAILSSRGSDSGIAEAIMASDAFSVEALIRPLSSMQGPARIVSLSEGISSRNFMLSQENSDIVFRLRNGISGENALKHALRVRHAVEESLQHFVATYDHGVSSIFRNGALMAPVVDLREPLPYLRLGPGEIGKAVGALLLTLTIALPIASLLAAIGVGRSRHLLAILATFCVGSIPYIAACLTAGGPIRLNLFVWLIVVPVTTYPVCHAFYFHRSH